MRPAAELFHAATATTGEATNDEEAECGAHDNRSINAVPACECKRAQRRKDREGGEFGEAGEEDPSIWDFVYPFLGDG